MSGASGAGDAGKMRMMMLKTIHSKDTIATGKPCMVSTPWESATHREKSTQRLRMTYKSSECEWTGYPCPTSREPRADRNDICNIEANHAEGEDRRRCSIPGKGEEPQESCDESSGPGTRDRRLRSWVYVIEPIGEWESAVPGEGKRLSRRSKKLTSRSISETSSEANGMSYLQS